MSLSLVVGRKMGYGMAFLWLFASILSSGKFKSFDTLLIVKQALSYFYFQFFGLHIQCMDRYLGYLYYSKRFLNVMSCQSESISLHV